MCGAPERLPETAWRTAKVEIQPRGRREQGAHSNRPAGYAPHLHCDVRGFESTRPLFSFWRFHRTETAPDQDFGRAGGPPVALHYGRPLRPPVVLVDHPRRRPLERGVELQLVGAPGQVPGKWRARVVEAQNKKRTSKSADAGTFRASGGQEWWKRECRLSVIA
jgi:hypothetical protein